MAFRIKWTLPAASDLEEVAVYLENRTDFLEAQRVVRAILTMIEKLEEFPYLDRPLEDYPRLRRRPYLGFAVVYEVFEDEKVIEVTRILSQRQSFRQHLP